MSNPELTLEAIEREVRKLAAERPDFVYTDQPERKTAILSGCSYVGAHRLHDDANEQYVGEGCIVGQALSRLGVTRETLVKYEGRPAGHVACDVLGAPVKVAWLNAVQHHQDRGNSWGASVRFADAAWTLVEG